MIGKWMPVGIAALAGVMLGVGVAQAHVTVWPREATVGANELYTIRVPSEKDVPTIQVRVEFPANVHVSRFVAAPGWQRQVEKDASGRIAAVTWSGGQIMADEVGIFQLQGLNGPTPGQVAWKAIQTYADGSVVAWVGPPGSSDPASLTQLTTAPMSPLELTQAATVGQVIAAVALLDGSNFHALHEAVSVGTIPTDSVGKVQRARLVTAAIQWPETLRPDALKLVEHLEHLQAAVRTENAAAAVGPAQEMHEVEHDLSQAAYAWLAQRGGLAAAGGGHND
jgi:uncharacterized protein YcnI